MRKCMDTAHDISSKTTEAVYVSITSYDGYPEVEDTCLVSLHTVAYEDAAHYLGRLSPHANVAQAILFYFGGKCVYREVLIGHNGSGVIKKLADDTDGGI